MNARMDLDTMEVERSPICRPDSDCWDVKLTFFDPSKVFERARKEYRVTVDVGDVITVTVGDVRAWFDRNKREEGARNQRHAIPPAGRQGRGAEAPLRAHTPTQACMGAG